MILTSYFWHSVLASGCWATLPFSGLATTSLFSALKPIMMKSCVIGICVVELLAWRCWALMIFVDNLVTVSVSHLTWYLSANYSRHFPRNFWSSLGWLMGHSSLHRLKHLQSDVSISFVWISIFLVLVTKATAVRGLESVVVYRHLARF